MAFDAIVVGGGLLGSATAYHLVAGGARTSLIEVSQRTAGDCPAGVCSDRRSWIPDRRESQ